MDPERDDPAAPQEQDLAGSLPAPAVQGDVPLPDPMLPARGVPLGDDPLPAPSGRRPVPVVRVGRPGRSGRGGRGASSVPPLPPLSPAPPSADDAFPLPGRVDFGDGLRISHRSMGLVVMVAMIPVVAVLGIVVVLSMGRGGSTPTDRGQQVSSGEDQPDGGASPSDAPAASSAARPPAGVRRASLDDAGDALRAADVGRVGKVEAAWTYRDGDTDVVLAVTRTVTRRNTNFSARAASLKVFAIADPKGKPTVLARTEDAGPTCPSGTEVKTSVPPAAVAVRDVGRNGTTEVFLATVHACGGDVRKQVTVFSGAAVYTLAGAGSLVAEPDPPYTDWPNGLLDAASEALDKA